MGQIDCVNKQSLLLDVVQALTDLNLTISKGYISSDAGWFMDGIYVSISLFSFYNTYLYFVKEYLFSCSFPCEK